MASTHLFIFTWCQFFFFCPQKKMASKRELSGEIRAPLTLTSLLLEVGKCYLNTYRTPIMLILASGE